jgi:hypothetical protein
VVENLNLSFGPHLAFLQPELVALKRFGVPRDGGYVGPPESIIDNSVIFCFGLSYEWSFETEISNQVKNARIFAFDPTVGLGEFVAESLAALKLIFNFSNNDTLYRRIRVFGYRLKVVKNYVFSFYVFRNKHIKKWVKANTNQTDNCIGIDEIFVKYADNKEVVLKIDIEGDEFEVLEEILKLGHISAVRSLFIEFHDLDVNWLKFHSLICKLKETHRLVHLHLPNMRTDLTSHGVPKFLEVTFVTKQLPVEGNEYRETLPVDGLDFPNRPESSDFKVQFN